MPWPTAQKIAALGSTVAGIAAFTYFKMVYVVPPGYIGLLYNSATDKIENYVMHPGSHIRFSWNENPVFLKAENNYHRTVADVATADKLKRGQTASGIDAEVKVQYKISVKDTPALYVGYGNEETYKGEVFKEVTDACASTVLAPYTLDALTKGLASNERFLRDELTKCLAKETATKYVVVEWAQLMAVAKRTA